MADVFDPTKNVHCEECRHRDSAHKCCLLSKQGPAVFPGDKDFCKYGERKDGAKHD